MACVTIQNMGIYDRCEKDVKNCRPHSLKPEEGLLTIDNGFLSFFVCIHLKPKGTKSQRQWKCWIAVHEAVHVLERLCLLFILLFAVYITHFTDQATFCWSQHVPLLLLAVYITCLCSLSLFTILRVHDMLQYYKTDFHLRHHCPQFSLLCRFSQSVMENCNKSTKQIALI